MASNRMYLKCRTCGELLPLGSCNYSPYEIYQWKSVEHPEQDYLDYRDALNEFYEKHFYCQNGDNVIHGDTQFTLVYENLDGKDIKVEEL